MVRQLKLDKYVSRFVDRHGRERFRFRKSGYSRYLPNPALPEYAEAYEAALRRDPRELKSPPVTPGTIEDLVRKYYRSLAWQQLSDVRRKNLRSVIEPFRAEHRDILVRHFRFDHIEAIVMRRAQPDAQHRRRRGGPHAAKRLRAQLIKLFNLAMKLGWIVSNPAALSDPVKAQVKGYHTWSDDQIEMYRTTHPIGTTARAAMEIMLWTFQRPGDAYRFGPQHLEGGKVRYTQAKTGRTLLLPAAKLMLEALAALPNASEEAFLVNAYGKPFSRAGFNNRFRKWCDEAGLPHCSAHGLRKAAAARLANHGATNNQLKAMGGWSNDNEVSTYTAAADQSKLAEAAMKLLSPSREQIVSLETPGDNEED
jgi:integrase